MVPRDGPDTEPEKRYGGDKLPRSSAELATEKGPADRVETDGDGDKDTAVVDDDDEKMLSDDG